MSSLADSLVSSSARKLTLRVRPDLQFKQQRYQGRLYWVVKDPVGLNYFRFQEEEYAILLMLDGNTSMDEIKDRFEAEFPPQKITVEEVQRFLGMLHQSGLIIADVPGQGHQLRQRRDKKVRKEWLGKFTNILAIRFKGFDPERILNFLLPLFRWMFRPAAVTLCVTLMLSAVLLVAVQFGEFQSRLPTFHQFFGPGNWLLLGAALGVTKIIHEFGHGLSCKYFGGECHEIGVMILVLTPCLYCNVSDSWMLPNKWHRAMIGAAGMYVELCIAAAMTWIWWFSDPTSTLNQLALSTMFVCSVSTVMFNANPLLRYDGYYILADVVEIPNLRQKASTILNRKLAWWCLGIEEQHDPFLPQRNQIFFALYTVASVAYRWFVVLAILFFLNKVFEPYGLKAIGQMIATMAIVGMIGVPIYKLGKYFYVPGRIEKVKKPRMYATLAIVVALIAAFCYVPFPYYVMCPVEIKPRSADPVYGAVAGVIDQIHVQPGDRVEKDDQIITLRSGAADLGVIVAHTKLQEVESELSSAQNERVRDPQASAKVPELRAARDQAREALQIARKYRQDLVRRAPKTGIVIAPPRKVEQQRAAEQLETWEGTPFQAVNRGAYLTERDVVCYVGDPKSLEAVLMIDQVDREFVRKGQEVQIQLDNLPLETFQGTIARIASSEVEATNPTLTKKAGGNVATETDPSGAEKPVGAAYHASVDINNPSGQMLVGTRGEAKVHAGYMSLGGRLWRYLARTFRFEI